MTFKNHSVSLLVAAALTLTGCGTPATPAEIAKREAARERAAAVLEASKKVRIGMSAKEVERAWGRPSSINRTTTARGTSEQWVYGSRYLYFTNDVLTTIQH